MRDYEIETKKRIEFIREVLNSSGAGGIVFGNSGGKDSALVGILCKMACENTLGIIMPCESKRNFGDDLNDATTIAKQFDIKTKTLDLTSLKQLFVHTLAADFDLTAEASANIPPRLRMTALYAIAAIENRLVAGTGNRSETYMGYFTKWGDGAHDFNPIADLTVTEIYEFLTYLNAPAHIINKSPSAGLFDGQTDEEEMGISYESIDTFLLTGTTTAHDMTIIDKFYESSKHKRAMPITFNDNIIN